MADSAAAAAAAAADDISAASVAESNLSEPQIPNPRPIDIPSPAIMPPPQIIHAAQVPAVFRPATPQFSPIPVQPPGAGTVPPARMMLPPPPYAAVPGQQLPPNPAFRPSFSLMPNGYPAMPSQGIPRYTSPYNPMARPVFLPRPPGVLGPMPPLMRPPIGIHGPIPAMVRLPVIANVAPIEKPQTTVYVGKIASTVENDFILAVLQLCGPVKSWKRAQDPTNGAPKGFGFCEFETAEGVLRALRLLSKLNIDGQELMINFNQATKEYLERYTEKKAENSKKLKEAENVGAEKGEDSTPSGEKTESPKPSNDEPKKEDKDEGSEKRSDSANFGTISNEDKEADRGVLEKLTFMIEERLKNNPLPPPPPLPAAESSNPEQPSKDGDSNLDDIRNGEDKMDENMSGETKISNEQERPEASSPDRSRRDDRRSRDRDRDRRDKERELERYEREREQERSRREREREYKNKEDDRRYKARVKDWESREREREYLRKQEKEKEKEREYMRKQDVLDQELEGDDGDSKRRKRKSIKSEDRRRRIREREDDFADRLEEEEEVAEAKRRAEEELRLLKEREKDAPVPLLSNETNGIKGEIEDEAVEMTDDGDNHIGDDILQNGDGDESDTGTISTSDMQHNNNISSKKLEFGLVGSGKRTAVPSVFNQEEDEDAHKDKKMRPLVPIDYSTEELQAVQSSTPVAPSSNLAAAAEFAKQISGATVKEDRVDAERERSRRPHDRSSHRDRNGAESNRTRDENRRVERERDLEQRLDKKKTPENQTLLDAKQLIDMIPKTKDELFSYKINWAVYEKNELHDRMKPWISKKITEFLGEEEPTLVDYIVSSTHEHVDAVEMLERLQSILDDEAEMFVLKMWRMLIFEIKKIESGLAQRAKS